MTTEEWAFEELLGEWAFELGYPRLVPYSILVGDEWGVGAGNGIAAAKAWYRGWDKANLAAPD